MNKFIALVALVIFFTCAVNADVHINFANMFNGFSCCGGSAPTDPCAEPSCDYCQNNCSSTCKSTCTCTVAKCALPFERVQALAYLLDGSTVGGVFRFDAVKSGNDYNVKGYFTTPLDGQGTTTITIKSGQTTLPLSFQTTFGKGLNRFEDKTVSQSDFEQLKGSALFAHITIGGTEYSGSITVYSLPMALDAVSTNLMALTCEVYDPATAQLNCENVANGVFVEYMASPDCLQNEARPICYTGAGASTSGASARFGPCGGDCSAFSGSSSVLQTSVGCYDEEIANSQRSLCFTPASSKRAKLPSPKN